MGASLSREEQDIDNTTKNDTTSSIKKKTTLLEQKINQYAILSLGLTSETCNRL